MKNTKNVALIISIFAATSGAIAYGAHRPVCKVTLYNDTKQPVWLVLNRDNHKTLKTMQHITMSTLKKHKANRVAPRKRQTFVPVASKELVGTIAMPSSKKFYIYSKDATGKLTYHLSVLQKWCSKQTKPTMLTMTNIMQEKTPDQFMVKYNRTGIHERIHSRFKNLKSSFTGWFKKALGK